ncbi:MAG: ring-cleaving dioxygenase [Caldilineaceae bacterium]|nr:ring-cleaving dioxygenase [Caldilineaceae bacterium]
MSTTVHGIHHVTAIAGDPQENLDFYVGVLGLRLVKRSVNQDAPDTYHLFYADADGTPGTDLTFFPWPRMAPARPGVGLSVEVAFAVAPESMVYWQERMDRHGVRVDALEQRFGETALPFVDPHGLRLALIATKAPIATTPWAQSAVPAEHQLRGMHSVRLWESRLAPTAALLTGGLGFAALGSEDGWHRYGVDGGGAGKVVDVKEMPGERHGAWGTGGIHHVAWRVTDTPEEMAVRAVVAAAGLQPTTQIDRFWFKSVYFREPGGVLFELATDGPGFDRDEDPAHLGEQLILPPWLEPHRATIEAGLPVLQMPG